MEAIADGGGDGGGVGAPSEEVFDLGPGELLFRLRRESGFGSDLVFDALESQLSSEGFAQSFGVRLADAVIGHNEADDEALLVGREEAQEGGQGRQRGRFGGRGRQQMPDELGDRLGEVGQLAGAQPEDVLEGFA